MGSWCRQLLLRFADKGEAESDARNARERPPTDPDPELERWCRQRLRELGLSRLARRVKVSWNRRMRTTAGRAWWPDGSIELNPRLKEIAESSENEIWRTLCHELAHLVAFERAGRRRIRAHGPEWQRACAELGIPGERASHELPFEGRRQRRKFAYFCGSCLTTIERVRRIRGAVACYDCCRRHSGGRFDERYLLVERNL